MGDEDGNVPNVGPALTYVELFSQVTQLREQIQQLVSREQVSAPATPVADFRVFPNLNQFVSVFNGKESTQEARVWLDTIRGIADLNGWPFNYRIQYVRAGAALNWYTGREFSNWSAVETQFKRIFIRELRTSDKWDALKGRFQLKTEHLMDYVMDKIRLCRDLQLTFSDTRDHVLEGVFARELAMYALARVHTCEEELIIDMLDLQRLSDRRNILFGPTGLQSVKQNAGTGVGKPDKTEALSVGNKTTTLQPQLGKVKVSNNVGPKCFNCNCYGHISHDCLKPKRPLKCSKCGADGHTRGKCTTETEEIPRVHQVQTLGKVSSLNSYVKTIFVNGNQLQGLIDTGCSVYIIRISSAEQSGIRWEPAVPLFVVGDIHTQGTTTVGQAMANIQVGEVETKDHLVLVIPDKSIPTTCLSDVTGWTYLQ